MSSPNVRVIPRDKLFAIFKTEEAVRMVEDMLQAINDLIPADTTALEAALDAHIADATDAHQASAVGFSPTGGFVGNNVQAALNELNGWPTKATPSGTVVGTSDTQTLSNKTLASPVVTGVGYFQQGAPASKAAAATLTAAELLGGLIEYTGAADNLTLPLGVLVETAVSGLAADRAFEFSVVNTGSGTATLVTALGLTLVGAMTVAAGESGMFRVRRTAANTFTVYRVA